MNDLVALTENKEVVYASFILHKNGIKAAGEPSFEEWLQCGEFINRAKGSVHFWIGDWLNYGEFRWGDKYLEAVKATGYDINTLRNDKWVASKVELSRRRDNLTFSHHAEVADLEPDEQDRLLDYAEEKKMDARAFRSYVGQGQPKGHPVIRTDISEIILINRQLARILVEYNFESMEQEGREALLNQLKKTADLINAVFKEWMSV